MCNYGLNAASGGMLLFVFLVRLIRVVEYWNTSWLVSSSLPVFVLLLFGVWFCDKCVGGYSLKNRSNFDQPEFSSIFLTTIEVSNYFHSILYGNLELTSRVFICYVRNW